MTQRKEKILVVGDVHAEFGVLNTLINKKKPTIVLQCGDFGYWPDIKAYPKVPDACKLYWCDGNHEHFWSLKERKSDEVWPNVFYMKRGSTLTLPDGRTVLFLGGAKSIDKEYRTYGQDWFEEEEISMNDITQIDRNQKIDIIISHTCPVEFMKYTEDGRVNDWSRKALSHVRQMFNPLLWYFGHWHCYDTGFTLGCRWTALSCIHEGTWWEELRNKGE